MQQESINPDLEYCVAFKDLALTDIARVGGKNASLGEMTASLGDSVPVPPGFAVTAQAYYTLITDAALLLPLREQLDSLDVTDTTALTRAGAACRACIMAATLPASVTAAILQSYTQLCVACGCPAVDVAVRSSATAEDLPTASFAGQQDSFLNIRGSDALLAAYHKCVASLFTDRAIAYRVIHGFDHFDVGISVGIQKMVRSDLSSSGVIFTIDTETGFKNAMFVTGSWGLGENIVQGAVCPDEWLLFKPTLAIKEFSSIIRRRLGGKEQKLVYATFSAAAATTVVRNVPTSVTEQGRFCVSDADVLQLGQWALAIEEHYSKLAGRYTPMDIEWAKDGASGSLFIVQARPETVQSQRNRSIITTYTRVASDARVLCSGQSVGGTVVVGKARVINSLAQMALFQPGEIIVTDMTNPDWAPIMKRAAGLVTNKGGRTCHAAIISREMGVPCAVGCRVATQVITDGATITLDCSAGSMAVVLDGAVPFSVTKTDVSHVPKLRTKVQLICANPDVAFETSFLPARGVGLVRMEFMISNFIKVHPMALVCPDKVAAADQAAIRAITAGYPSGAECFVSKLTEGVALICAAHWPHEVVLRFSDFKSNEYAALLGGKAFEPVEENPMIGWRGASRYYDAAYIRGFALECAAVKRVRESLGLANLVVMIPFARTVDEVLKVLAVMRDCGLERGSHGLCVYAMCEIPSNVILAEEFLTHLDGFSIGSNDLTQLTLGLDRDSALVAGLFDETNPAVMKLIAQVIETCRRLKKHVGLCGQAASDHADFVDFLVECGIDSISVQADAVFPTVIKVAKKEAAIDAAMGSTTGSAVNRMPAAMGSSLAN